MAPRWLSIGLWGHLGLSWGHFGASSGPTWCHFGPFWCRHALQKQKIEFSQWFSNDFKVTFEPSWGHVGSILAHLGAILGHLGALLGHLGVFCVPTPIGKICCQSASRFKKGVLGATLRHLGAILGAKKIWHSSQMVSRWPKMAPRWPKVTRRWPKDGLSGPQDG